MAIEKTDGGGFIVTGEADTRLYQIIALRTMLATEIRTGMKFSHRGSPFQMLKNLGIIPENIRTKKKGLEIVTEYVEKQKLIRQAKADVDKSIARIDEVLNNGNAES